MITSRIEEGSVKAKAIFAIVFIQIATLATNAWADTNTGDERPHVSDIGGSDHSPGVTAVIFITLLIVGFGIGFSVGRRTRNK
jgi:hypothetical protein